MATPKRTPAKKKAPAKEPVLVPAPVRIVTELLVWRAEMGPFGPSRAIDFFAETGERFRVCGINDDVAAQLVAMLQPQPPPGPVVG